jgi:hypothetical protein
VTAVDDAHTIIGLIPQLSELMQLGKIRLSDPGIIGAPDRILLVFRGFLGVAFVGARFGPVLSAQIGVGSGKWLTKEPVIRMRGRRPWLGISRLMIRQSNRSMMAVMISSGASSWM